MTLTLAPEIEARVRSVAELSGQDPEDALIALLNQALADAEADLAPLIMDEEEKEQVVAALRKSEEDYTAGRWISLEDYEARIAEKRKKRLEKAVTV